ncbi:MAG: helix-turn-helix domain-containing protein, partial [Bryobacteraceae bacterium]|nr:helix-turn-helix domain-containing protein [Bryobacteraceae bacterium]
MTKTAVTALCPGSGTKGKKVGTVTLHALVKDGFRGQIAADADWYFCDAKGCDVVYFTTDVRTITKSQLKVEVGVKETTGDRPLCYCFGHSVESIKTELVTLGKTTALEDIRTKMADPGCSCPTTNPSGSCCLGTVAKGIETAKKEVALLTGTVAGESQPNSQGAAEDVQSSALTGRERPKEKVAFLATAGAAFTAVVGSACCWLPLLLIAFGFSAAGVGSFFESYRPYFLTVTFALLGVAWYFTYRTAIWRAWARLRGKLAPVPAVEACCDSEAPPAAAHSCCATEPEPAAVAGQPVRRRFTVRRFNQVMLWVATVVILLFAMFPRWSGLLFGGGDTTTAVNADDQQQLVLELKGMTCEGCAATIEKALRGLGLSKNEVKVYVYLSRTGEHKASEISEALSLHRTETYRILRDLEKRGLISSVFEKPLKFIATPFEKALDILIETKRMKLNLLEKKRQNLVNIWLSLPKPEVELERKEGFQILEGEEQISLKA